MSKVLPGSDDVFASDFLPVSMFIKLDLPTLERPMNAYSFIEDSGHFLTSGEEIKNFAVFIFICQWN